MSDTPTIGDGKVVTIHYKLRVDGEVVSETTGHEPMPYLHGASNIVPGLESELTGRAAGDELTVTVEPGLAYGEHNPAAVETIPREVFPEDLALEVGLQLSAQQEDGSVVPMTVQAIADKEVTVDLNHPLAGKTLEFEVNVVEVRDASAEETEHGHVHGPGGHHH